MSLAPLLSYKKRVTHSKGFWLEPKSVIKVSNDRVSNKAVIQAVIIIV